MSNWEWNRETDEISLSTKPYKELCDIRNRRVDDTTVLGDVRISTVFLVIDHGFGESSRPVVFETMIFNGRLDDFCHRYYTAKAAREGHKIAVQAVLEEWDYEKLDDALEFIEDGEVIDG